MAYTGKKSSRRKRKMHGFRNRMKNHKSVIKSRRLKNRTRLAVTLKTWK